MQTEVEEFDTTHLFSITKTAGPRTQFQQMPSHGNFGTKMNLQLVMQSYSIFFFKKKLLFAKSRCIVKILEGTTYIPIGNTKTPF